MQLRNPIEDELIGQPFGLTEYSDPDLGRRLRRRGWVSVGEDDSSWSYPPSLEVVGDPETAEVRAAAAEYDAAFDVWRSAMSDWLKRAEDAGAEDATAAAQLIGPEPAQPPRPFEDADETFIFTGDDGASYKVVAAGFDSDVESRIYTDRHKLLSDLDEIETWRYGGPARRVVPARAE
ncbi:MAG TPA: hypothetical protein VGL36_35810 [Kribbella sp.]